MMTRSTLGCMLLAATVFSACSPDHSEEIASLQKQVAALTRQVEDMRRQVNTIQDGQQKLRELVGNLEVEIGRLKPQVISQPAPVPQVSKEQGASVASAPAPTPQGTVKVPCPQVWKLLGQGQDEATVARTLGATEAAVRACEQEVGRRGGRR